MAECADSERNAQTHGGMRRLRAECADSERDTQTHGEIRRLMAEYADSEQFAQTPSHTKDHAAISSPYFLIFPSCLAPFYSPSHRLTQEARNKRKR